MFNTETDNIDFFKGTPFEDRRSRTQRIMDDLQQQKNNRPYRGLSGLPMFDPAEREAMATVQSNIFSQEVR